MADVTIDTYANEAALPGSPADGDMAYLTDNDRVYVYDGDASKWRYWDNDGEEGVDANDLAYPDAKSGNPTSGTNYVITVQPDCHYDASKYVEAADDGLAAGLGDAVDLWGDRSGNANDATQTNASDQPTYVKNQGNFGLQWPDATSLGGLDTNYTPATDSPGHTLVVVADIPIGSSYAGMLNNAGYSTLYRAGFTLTASLDFALSSAGVPTSFYPSSPTNLAAQYTRVYAGVDVDDDQKTFLNLAQSQSGTVSYTEVNLNNKLDANYFIGANGYQTMGATAANGHGGIIYEALIFQSALSYTVTDSNLSAGNLKIIVDYLMNKYNISTDLIS